MSGEPAAERTVGSCLLRLVREDITLLAVDAIVNPANGHLAMDGGVAAAIKRRGGGDIEAEALAAAVTPLAAGEVVVTRGGRLEAGWVLHAVTVSERLRSNRSYILLATRNVLRCCAEMGLARVAFPALGTGVGGVPVREAAGAMLQALAEHAAVHEHPREVWIALPAEEDFKTFALTLEALR